MKTFMLWVIWVVLPVILLCQNPQKTFPLHYKAWIYQLVPNQPLIQKHKIAIYELGESSLEIVRLPDFRSKSIVVEHPNSVTSVPIEYIHKITVGEKKPGRVWTGVAIGAAAGFGIGYLIGYSSSKESNFDGELGGIRGAVVFTPIGAVAGGIIASQIKVNYPIYGSKQVYDRQKEALEKYALLK